MTDLVDWSMLAQRCAAAQQRHEEKEEDAQEAPIAKARQSPAESPSSANFSEDDALSSCEALSDCDDENDSLADMAPPPLSPLPAPPLTPVPPPPLSMPRARTQRSTAAAAMPTSPLLPPPSSSPKPSKRHAHVADARPAAVYPTSRAADGRLPSTTQHYRHRRHHHRDASAQRPRTVRALSTTEVEMIQLSLRRLDVVRTQRSALAARTVKAHAHLAETHRRLSETDVACGPRPPAANRPDDEGPEAASRRRRAVLVRQLRALDHENDKLRCRHEELQRERAHAATLRHARLRRHPSVAHRGGHQATVHYHSADADFRSLSPIRDASCLSQLATPFASPAPLFLDRTAHRTTEQQQQQLHQQQLSHWIDRQAEVARQHAQLTVALELAMARERGRQQAVSYCCAEGLVRDDDVAEASDTLMPPSVQLSSEQ